MKVGERSPYVDLLRSTLANCRVEVLPGLGHFPQLEAPERVNGLIAEFCR
jgi:pimeloyl-ACP methyl ester carboxylesterase